MKGREALFSAFKEVDLTAFLAGAKAAAPAIREEIRAVFIMVEASKVYFRRKGEGESKRPRRAS